MPDPDVIITTNPNYNFYHNGEDVILSCIVSYPPNIWYYIDVPTQAMIQWTKNGSIINDDSVEPTNNIYVSNMTLSSISASDAGTYNCTAVIGSNDSYVMSSNIVTASFDLSLTSKQIIFHSTL